MSQDVELGIVGSVTQADLAPLRDGAAWASLPWSTVSNDYIGAAATGIRTNTRLPGQWQFMSIASCAGYSTPEVRDGSGTISIVCAAGCVSRDSGTGGHAMTSSLWVARLLKPKTRARSLPFRRHSSTHPFHLFNGPGNTNEFHLSRFRGRCARNHLAIPL